MTSTAGFYFKNYQEWRHALTVRCKIDLTPDYALQRLAALRNPEEPSTRSFTVKYGEAYLRQVIRWFEQATLTSEGKGNDGNSRTDS